MDYKTYYSNLARDHVNEMNRKFLYEINGSIAHSVIYNSTPQIIIKNGIDLETSHLYDTKICIMPVTTVDAIMIKSLQSYSKMCALNFASFKHPGGQFLEGSTTQEEALCHKSTLYNVLKYFDDSYYAENRKMLNKSLYMNRALYTPNILFIQDRIIRNCDVITCAAPNAKTGLRYRMVTPEEVYNTLVSRIDMILAIAAHNMEQVLILGAWGCGVFGNNINDVATIFVDLITGKYRYCFQEIIFAIPDMNTYNRFCDAAMSFKER
jgi:uncharacterized protein (TIGR02452 family)